jgi:hypothetical protein
LARFDFAAKTFVASRKSSLARLVDQLRLASGLGLALGRDSLRKVGVKPDGRARRRLNPKSEESA